MTAVLQSHWSVHQPPPPQTHHWLQSCSLLAISGLCGQSRNWAWHFTCWLCVSNFIIYALCPYNWQKMRRGDQSSPFSGLDRATKTGACNTNDLQTFAYFTGSCAQLSQQVPRSPPGGNCASAGWVTGVKWPLLNWFIMLSKEENLSSVSLSLSLSPGFFVVSF